MQKKTKLSKQEQRSRYEYKTNSMVDIYCNISVIRLNVNGLKTLIKNQDYKIKLKQKQQQ